MNWTKDGRLIVVALGDGTIRWLRATDGHAVLSLFAERDGKRWVAWTPEGFFTGSLGAESMVGYQIDQGPDREGLFVSSSQLYAQFYRPDLVAARLSGDEAPLRAAVAEVGDVREVLARGAPPRVSILGPAQRSVASRDFDLEVEVTDQGGGVGDLLLFVQGKRVAVDGGRAAGLRSPGVRRIQVQGVEGENPIEVRVTNRQGVESEPARARVRVQAPGTAPASLYLVAVGIDAYQDPQLGALRFAGADAQELAKVLRSQGHGVFSDRIHTRVLKTREETTRAAVEQAVAEVARKAGPQDVFVLYLAGHGEAVNSRYRFITSEGPGAGLDHERIAGLLASVKAQKSLLVLDTCFAGAALGGVGEDGAIRALLRATGASVLAASSAKQWAMEGYRGHGVYSYFLVEGLRGDADRASGHPDGRVTLSKLSAYLDDQVPRHTEALWNRRQEPERQLVGRDFPLTVVERDQ